MANKVGDRVGPQCLYKGHYAICFYDKQGERFIESFDNIRQILAYKNEPITRFNINRLNVLLCRSLKTQNHYTKILNGKLMTVWIVDLNDDNEDDLKEVNHETNT